MWSSGSISRYRSPTIYFTTPWSTKWISGLLLECVLEPCLLTYWASGVNTKYLPPCTDRESSVPLCNWNISRIAGRYFGQRHGYGHSLRNKFLSVRIPAFCVNWCMIFEKLSRDKNRFEVFPDGGNFPEEKWRVPWGICDFLFFLKGRKDVICFTRYFSSSFFCFRSSFHFLIFFLKMILVHISVNFAQPVCHDKSRFSD